MQVIEFIEKRKVPTGPLAGQKIQLAPFQKQFIRGALGPNVLAAVLSVARGNGKSTLTAGIGLAALLGIWFRGKRREILVAARTKDQARIVWDYAAGLSESLDKRTREKLFWRRSPVLEVEFTDDNGPHVLRCISADPKNCLGASPNLAILDERGHWPADKGDALESALLSGLGKRGGRALIISTSAPDDAHSLSQWLDNPPPGTYVQEHRPPPSLPADDLDSILMANPGAQHGVGSSVEWLQAQAARSISRGGAALTAFRLYNRNERVSDENRSVLLTVDQWLACEVSELPPREGACIVGIDLGGSASMTAAVMYWPESGRLETLGAFPKQPSLKDRGARDGVGSRYSEMFQRDELITLGGKVVPVSEFLREVLNGLDASPVCFVADRFRQGEFEEALAAANLRVPIVWRGQGFRDGGEDVERFRQAAFDGLIACAPSLLLRSAMAESVCLVDPANNSKLAKGRSKGRIDAAAAAVLAVAEGIRRSVRPRVKTRAPMWV